MTVFSDLVEVIEDDQNHRCYNLIGLFHHTPVDASVTEAAEGAQGLRALYPFAFPSLTEAPRRLGELPTDILERARAGRALLVLDDTCEGAALVPHVMAEIHHTLEGLGVDPARVALGNHNVDFARTYRHWCAMTGVERPLEIFYHHSWLRGSVNEIVRHHRADGEEPVEVRFERFATRMMAGLPGPDGFRPKTFLSFNFAARDHRILFLLELLDRGLLDEASVSFGGFDKKVPRGREEAVAALAAAYPQFVRLRGRVAELEARTPLTVAGDTPKDAGAIILDFAPDPYLLTDFSVVTESDFHRFSSRRVTEKSLKPLLNFHPFITLANPGTLALLRGLGFRTFDGLIDETYDTVADPLVRFDLVVEEVERLAKLPRAERAALRIEMAPVLEHNARRLVFELDGYLREQQDLPTLRALAEWCRID